MHLYTVFSILKHRLFSLRQHAVTTPAIEE